MKNAAPARDRVHLGEEDRVFVLTGAGVSAESGLPTFLGKAGEVLLGLFDLAAR